MSAGSYSITLEQYASFTLPITWNDATGNPVNLTGFTADLNVQAAGGMLIAAFSSTNGTLVLGGVLGTITITLTPAQGTAMPPGQYAYDLLLTSPTGVKTRLLEGGFNVVAGVTPA